MSGEVFSSPKRMELCYDIIIEPQEVAKGYSGIFSTGPSPLFSAGSVSSITAAQHLHGTYSINLTG